MLLPCLLHMPAGGIDRVRLGQLVFSDAAARQRLNRATHLPVALDLLRQLLLCWLCLRRLVVSGHKIPLSAHDVGVAQLFHI